MATAAETRVRITARDETKAAFRSVQTSAQKLSKAVNFAGLALGGTLVARELGQVAHQIINISDRMNEFTARTRLASDGLGDFQRNFDNLANSAIGAGTKLEDAVFLFQGLARAAPELGATNGQILQLQDAVQKLGAVSGTATTQMRAGMLQFTQAMAMGTVRAEEFNSLIENIPELAKAIADGMGTTTGQLKLMVNQGELLSKEVFAAILSQMTEIEKKFDAMPRTVKRATEGFATSLALVVKSLDEASGFSAGLASYIDAASVSLLEMAGLEVPLSLLQLQLKQINAELKEMDASEGKKKLEAEKQTLEYDILIKKGMLGRDLADVEAAIAVVQAKVDELNPRIKGALDRDDLESEEGVVDRIARSFGKASSAVQAHSISEAALTAEWDKQRVILNRLLEVKRQVNAESAIASQNSVVEASRLEEERRKKEEELKRKSFESSVSKLDTTFESELEQMRNHGKTALDIERQQYAERLQLLDDAYAAKALTIDKYNKLQQKAVSVHAHKVRKISEEESKAEEEKAAKMEGIARGVLAAGAQHSRALFELQKVAALADLAVQTPQAASAAFAWGMKLGGPPLAAAFASAAVAAQAIRARAIASASFGGGGGGGGGNVAPSAPSVVEPVEFSNVTGTAEEKTPVTVNIYGNISGNDGQRVFEEIKKAINEDGQLLIEARSSNGRLLRR